MRCNHCSSTFNLIVMTEVTNQQAALIERRHEKAKLCVCVNVTVILTLDRNVQREDKLQTEQKLESGKNEGR